MPKNKNRPLTKDMNLFIIGSLIHGSILVRNKKSRRWRLQKSYMGGSISTFVLAEDVRRLMRSRLIKQTSENDKEEYYYLNLHTYGNNNIAT